MTKMAHHHPHTYEIMGKAQDWLGRIIFAVAIVGGAIVLFSAAGSHGSITW